MQIETQLSSVLNSSRQLALMIDWGQMPRRLWLTEHTSLACHCQCSKQSGETTLQSSASSRSYTAVKNKQINSLSFTLLRLRNVPPGAKGINIKYIFCPVSVVCPHHPLMPQKSQELACLASYPLPICGFGSAFWSDVWISQSVIKHQSAVWCVLWGNECQRKKGKCWQRSARWSFFFFFLMGIRCDNRQTGSRFLSPVFIRQD